MSMGNKVLRFENGTAGPVQVLEKISELQRILSGSVFMFPGLKREFFVIFCIICSYAYEELDLKKVF